MPDSCPASLARTPPSRGEPYGSARRPAKTGPSETLRAITSSRNDYHDPRNRYYHHFRTAITIISESPSPCPGIPNRKRLGSVPSGFAFSPNADESPRTAFVSFQASPLDFISYHDVGPALSPSRLRFTCARKSPKSFLTIQEAVLYIPRCGIHYLLRRIPPSQETWKIRSEWGISTSGNSCGTGGLGSSSRKMCRQPTRCPRGQTPC